MRVDRHSADTPDAGPPGDESLDWTLPASSLRARRPDRRSAAVAPGRVVSAGVTGTDGPARAARRRGNARRGERFTVPECPSYGIDVEMGAAFYDDRGRDGRGRPRRTAQAYRRTTPPTAPSSSHLGRSRPVLTVAPGGRSSPGSVGLVRPRFDCGYSRGHGRAIRSPIDELGRRGHRPDHRGAGRRDRSAKRPPTPRSSMRPAASCSACWRP